MNILQMVDIPWDSGLAHYALVLAQGLQKNGHRVYFGSKPSEKPAVKAQRLGLETMPWVTLPDLFRLRTFLQDNKIDIVNAHTGSTHSLSVAATRGLPTRVIRTRSDARPVSKSFGSRFVFDRTVCVIAAADYIRQDFIRVLGLPEAKVKTVYQGLDLADFPVAPLPDSPALGILARLDPVKGHAFLLDALAQLKTQGFTPRLDIVGQQENIKQKDLEALVSRLGLEKQVKFWGYQTDIPGSIRACSIGIIASTGSEAVSRAALEWMASGRPVIATRVGCLPELVEEGKTGFLVPPSDATALAHAIVRLLSNPALISSMGSAARRLVESRFSLETCITQTEHHYNAQA